MTHSVVIVTRDRSDELSRLLHALHEQTRSPDEILIIDASRTADFRPPSDYTFAIPVRRIITKAGIAHQRNTGLDAARGDIISFFDDDTIPEVTYFAHVLDRFSAEPLVVGITGVQTDVKSSSNLEHAMRTLFMVQRKNGRNRFRISGFPDLGPTFNKTRYIDISNTCALSFRAEAAANIRIPEEIFSGVPLELSTGRCFGEDVWFTHQLRKEGLLLQLDSAEYQHEESPRTREDTFTTQSLYIYAMRILSNMAISHPIHRVIRLWALTGQAAINGMQALRFLDTGYILGFIKAMSVPLCEKIKPRPQALDEAIE